MTFKNTKWQNLIVLSSIIFVIISVFNLIPSYIDITFKVFALFQREKEISEGKDNQLQLDNVLIENKNLKNIINSYLTNYEENKNISTIINTLYNSAKRCHIIISSIKPLKVFKKEDLWLQPIEISFISNYERIFNFIRFMEKSDKIIIVRQLNILSKKQDENLHVKFVVDVYLNL